MAPNHRDPRRLRRAAGSELAAADRDPEHPEYPSDHATDCFTGAAVRDAVFGRNAITPIAYITANEQAQVPPQEMTMGQHVQSGTRSSSRRIFESFDAAGQDCADSRIWSGAHFPAARDESKRLADAIAARALAAVPPLTTDDRSR